MLELMASINVDYNYKTTTSLTEVRCKDDCDRKLNN